MKVNGKRAKIRDFGLISGSNKEEMLNRISESVRKNIYDSCLESRSWSTGIFESRSGVMVVEANEKGEIEVAVCHKDNSHESPMIEALIASRIPNWSKVKEIANVEIEKEKQFRDYLLRNSRYW